MATNKDHPCSGVNASESNPLIPLSVVDFTGFEPGVVLAELYNSSRPVGMGLLQYRPEIMTPGEAQNLLEDESEFFIPINKYFDYLRGRPLKTSFKYFPKLESIGFDESNHIKMHQVLEKLKGDLTMDIPKEAPTQKDERVNECDPTIKMHQILEKLKGDLTMDIPREAPTQKDERVNECDADAAAAIKMIKDLLSDPNSCTIDDFDRPPKKFDTVYLTDDYVKKAIDMEIPYPKEWFMVIKLTDDYIQIVGSMGGSLVCARSDRIFRKDRGITFMSSISSM